MRQIKFRGRTPDGEICYGDYCRGLSKEMPAIRDWTRLRYMDVEPESVAQLVGHDINGDEVYEGDIVIKGDGNRHMVTMGDIFNVWQFQLKEAQS